MQSPTDAIALLIDADNVSALPESRIALIFSKLERLGVVSIRRAYGQWGRPQLKGWSEVLHKYAITPIQQFSYSTGKNATDIALTIDAMDLLHSSKLQKFCIVSCDSDFTPLVVRLRGQGLEVYGFGEYGKTSVAFREACSDFTYLERGIPQSAPETPPANTATSGQITSFEQPGQLNGKNGQLEKLSVPAANGTSSKSSQASGDLPEPIFHEAVTNSLNSTGWAEALAVGAYLSRHQKRKADYNTSTWVAYYKKFSRIFEVQTNNGQNLIRVIGKD